METNYTTDQIRRARKVDLFSYLQIAHPDSFTLEYDSLRPTFNHSISIKRGYSGYRDFATDETGNSIDFLVNYMNYSMTEAVNALLGEDEFKPESVVPANIKNKDNNSIIPVGFPVPVQGSYKNLFAYLLNRGICKQTIQILCDRKIIYQEKTHNNIVFVNPEKDFAEIRGTYSLGGKGYHGVASGGRRDGFWWLKNSNEKAETAYICESAIDAISLYELHRLNKKDLAAVYISIAGVGKQATIDRIKTGCQKSGIECVLAVDNCLTDKAAKMCIERNQDLKYINPTKKDWNEDLVNSLEGEF